MTVDDELSVRGDSTAAEFYRIPLTPICRKKTKIKGCRRSWARAWTSVAERGRGREEERSEAREREETDSNLKLYVRQKQRQASGLWDFAVKPPARGCKSKY
jgi:hypothetical protein